MRRLDTGSEERAGADHLAGEDRPVSMGSPLLMFRVLAP